MASERDGLTGSALRQSSMVCLKCVGSRKVSTGQDLVGSELHALRIDLFLHQQGPRYHDPLQYFDDDGGCYVTVFAGPKAEWRARDYLQAQRRPG